MPLSRIAQTCQPWLSDGPRMRNRAASATSATAATSAACRASEPLMSRTRATLPYGRLKGTLAASIPSAVNLLVQAPTEADLASGRDAVRGAFPTFSVGKAPLTASQIRSKWHEADKKVDLSSFVDSLLLVPEQHGDVSATSPLFIVVMWADATAHNH